MYNTVALYTLHAFPDELSSAASPLTFQRYTAFQAWIPCNLFFHFFCIIDVWLSYCINCKFGFEAFIFSHTILEMVSKKKATIIMYIESHVNPSSGKPV